MDAHIRELKDRIIAAEGCEYVQEVMKVVVGIREGA